MTFPAQKFYHKFCGLPIILLVLLPFLQLQANTEAGTENETVKVLSLEECISLAVSSNPAFLSSAYTVEESRLKTIEARSSFYPSVNLNAGADVYTYRQDEERGKSGAYSQYNAGITAQYYFYQGGKKIAVYDAAESAFQAASYQHEGGFQDLVLNVSQAYYRFLQSLHMEKAALQALDRAEYYLEFAQARFEAGVVSRSDILKAEVERSNAELSLIRARNNRLFASGMLNVFLGRDVHLPIQVRDDLEKSEQKGSLEFEPLLSRALENRPEAKKMEAQIAAQESDIRIARSNFYPWISADTGVNLSGLSTSGTRGGWFAGISLSLPVFTGFANQARTAQEKTALSALEKQRLTLEHEIGQEVWNAYLDLKESEERIDNTAVLLVSARENLAIAEEEYREGIGSMIEVIDAETALVAAEESQIEAFADFKIALAVIDRVVGISKYTADQGDKK
ncbi:MAG: TolC family protein [Candidatus Aminicenantes bacterium]